MICHSTLRSLLFRLTLGVAAASVAAPLIGYSAPAAAKRKKTSRSKGKKAAKARAAKRKKDAQRKKAAAVKAEKEMHAKHTGAIERLEQIAKATKNDALMKTVERLKIKEDERHKLVAGE